MSERAAPNPRADDRDADERKTWTPAQRRLLLIVALATAMSGIDTTVVTVALPRMGADLHASLAGMQWTVDAYNLLYGASLLAAGVAADRFGHTRVFTVGVVGFALASAVIGLAPDTLTLDCARALQGLTAAVLAAGGLARLTTTFPGAQRARALGVFAAVTSLSFIVGPLLGGILVDGPGWRTAFFLNLPVAAAVLLLGRGLPDPHVLPGSRPLDLPGITFSTLGLLAVMYGVIAAPERGWADPVVLGCLLLGALFLAGFLLAETRVPAPLLELRLFRSPTLSGALAALLLLVASFFGLLPFLSTWLQEVRGYSALLSGLALLPIIVPFLVTAPLGAKLSARLGPGPTVGLGCALTAAGTVLLALGLPGPNWVPAVCGLVVMGAGGGACQAPLMNAPLSSVPPDRAGLASGLTNSVRPLGITAGVAVLGVVLAGRVQHAVDTAPAAQRTAAGPDAGHLLAAGRLPQGTGAAVRDMLRSSYTSGLTALTFTAAGLSAAAALIAVCTIRRPEPAAEESETEQDRRSTPSPGVSQETNT